MKLNTTAKAKHETREEYLVAAVEQMKPLFERINTPLPGVHVSTGWPSKLGTSAKKRRIGECWDSATSPTDKHPHIFISPVLMDDKGPNGVLATLAHELVHAAVGCSCGHKGAFRKTAKALGFSGPMKSTPNMSPELTEAVECISENLGAYPHGPIVYSPPEKQKKDVCRLVKCECGECGYVVRTTRKWLELKGAPICPCNRKDMEVEEREVDQ
jgi:hypothetical protein